MINSEAKAIVFLWSKLHIERKNKNPYIAPAYAAHPTICLLYTSDAADDQ